MTAEPTNNLSVAPSGALWSIVPGLHNLVNYRRELLRADLMAGITLAAYLLPAALGDASLANLAPEAGLYACLFSGLVFWLFCSSRQTSITVTSAISLLIGSSLGGLAGGDGTRFAALAACTAILVGAIALFTWLVRAGVVVNFVSETVLLGFKCGIALVLTSVQLPKLFGFKGTHGSFFECVHFFLSHLGQTHLPSLAVGLTALAILLLGKVFLKNKPVALAVVIASIAVASMAGLADHGVKMLGNVPRGVPSPGLPNVTLTDINELLPVAMACFLLAAVETAAIGRMFALKHRYRLDMNSEFLAMAASNIAAGMGHGLPVGGGMSQSLVNEAGGARTSISGLVASAVILIVVLFFSGLLHNLPQPVLAAIVLTAVTGLVKLKALKHLWRFSRAEFAVSTVALLFVLESGILRGVLVGVVFSLVLLLRRASRPQTTELGQVPGTDLFEDLSRSPSYLRVPGVFVFRVRGAMLYFNVDHIRDRFFELLAQRGQGVRLVAFFLGTVPTVDLAGAELLAELCDSLQSQGIDLRLAEPPTEIRQALLRSGFEDACGPIKTGQTVSAIVTEWMMRADRQASFEHANDH